MHLDLTPQFLWSPPPLGQEHDCARSVVDFIPTSIPLSSSTLLWNRSTTLTRQRLPNNHTLYFNPFGPVSVTVLDAEAVAQLERYQTPRPLNDALAWEMAQLGLLQPEGTAHGPPTVTLETLTAWIHVTNECNLRCTYCYLHKTEDVMTAETGQAAVKAVFRTAAQHGFKTVKLKYAGGEASLNSDLIQQLHQQAQTLAAQQAIALEAVVLSNGVSLKDDFLDFLQGNNIRLMISLDGVGEAHDAQRVFANGRGSFKQVVGGIKRAIKHGLQPHLSITVTAQNAANLAAAVSFALDYDLPFNLNFYRDNVYAKDPEHLQAEDEQLIAGMKRAFQVIEERLPQRSLINGLVDRANFGGSHTHTCGVGQNYMVIDHNGQVSRCQMEIEKPATTVSADDLLIPLQTADDGFQNLPVDEKEGCRDCEWRYWCAGGCPLLTHRVTGRSDVKSPYCNVYKALYPEVLRLEGLRLLKWKDKETVFVQ